MIKTVWRISLVSLCLLLINCRRDEKKIVHILYTGNLSGYLESCGCPEGRVGGMTLLNRAIKDSLARWRAAPLIIDAGDFTDPDAPSDSLRHRAMLTAFKLMNYQAINVTPRLLASELADLRWAADSLRLPIISANLIDSSSGQHPFPGWVKVRINQIQIGIIGLGSMASPIKIQWKQTPYKFTEPITALRSALAEIRPSCDLIIVLCDFTVRVSRSLGLEVPGIDLVISTRDLPPTTQPKQFGAAFVVGPSHKGKYITSLALQQIASNHWSCNFAERLIDDKITEDPEIRKLIDQYHKLKIEQTRLLPESK
ncbi:MAG: hypothetical protein NTW14_03715 [bacterium]|nr:hypothetical protein [bacterium]